MNPKKAMRIDFDNSLKSGEDLKALNE